MMSRTPRLRRMIATALPMGIHIAFISASLVQARTPTPASGVPHANHAERLNLLMPSPGVRAGIVPEVTQNAWPAPSLTPPVLETKLSPPVRPIAVEEAHPHERSPRNLTTARAGDGGRGRRLRLVPGGRLGARSGIEADSRRDPRAVLPRPQVGGEDRRSDGPTGEAGPRRGPGDLCHGACRERPGAAVERDEGRAVASEHPWALHPSE